MSERKPRPNAGETELALTVELHGADDALLRVLSTLHRRRCRVTAAEFGSDDGPSAWLTLRVQAPSAHAGRIAHWLASLIDVQRVRTVPSGAAVAEPCRD